jgi:lipopolysaccharide biosynthesis regulator YciM
MPVVQFTAELYPTSVNTQRMLARVYIDVGDYPAAIDVYSKLLEQNPDDIYIMSQLEWLRLQ